MLKSMADHVSELRAYGAMGFKPEATLRERFFFPDGEAPYHVPLAMPPQAKTDES